MRFEEANALMLPGHDQDAVEELPDGQVRVHIVDPLPGVTPEMYEWWFGHMERDTYMQWHPRDHEEFAWVSGWEPGRYVGATHMTRQTFGRGGPAQPQPEIAARFVHLGIRRDYGTELRSSFWLSANPGMDIERATAGRTKHVHEECQFLCGFLPELYARHADGRRSTPAAPPNRPAAR